MALNKLGTIVLETPRMILRPFRYDDADAMFKNYCHDEEVCRYLTWQPHASVEVTRAILDAWIPQYENPLIFRWAMELKETHEVIGSIDIVHLAANWDSGELGWVLGRAYWGQGLMPEAFEAVRHFLFRFVGFHRLEACHDVENPKSGRVMQKGGMKFEGFRREAFKDHDGRYVDLATYAILAKDDR